MRRSLATIPELAARHATVAVLTALVLYPIAGCEMEQRTVHSTWGTWAGDDHDEVRGGYGGKVVDPEGKRTQRAAPQWSILLATLEGEDRRKRAELLRSRLANQMRIPDVWITETDEKSLVYRGRYGNPTADTARDTVRQTRMLKVDGRRPFAESQIVSTAAAATGIAGPYDLRQFPGMFTLQIEVYDDQIGNTYRSVAENRVRTLRRDGTQAYCYHGPFRSQVTVGLFTRDEAFVALGVTESYAPAVKELQKKFPHNLYNGSTMIEKAGGRSIGEQTSSLVRVPE